LNAPVPLKTNLNTTYGNFTFAYDTSANLTSTKGGKYHNYTDGRDFHYRQVGVEIDTDIEINIIVQEFCDICTDRSNLSDFHVVTLVCLLF
jgi:hypothetical protein